MTEQSGSPAPEIGADSTSISGLWNEPLRARVDATFAEHQRALERADKEREKTFASLQEALEDQLVAQKELLLSRLDQLEKQTQQRFEQQQHAIEVASVERENAAASLRAATDKADVEREKAAQALATAQSREIQAGDNALNLHFQSQVQQIEAAIEASKQRSDARFEASEKAIARKDAADEKRFESINAFRGQLHDQQQLFLPRELFDQAQIEHRRRNDAQMDFMQNIATRVTEIEARGGGEKDHSSELKSTLALAVAVVGSIGAIAIGLISLLGQ
jgi:hypothetical protein